MNDESGDGELVGIELERGERLVEVDLGEEVDNVQVGFKVLVNYQRRDGFINRWLAL